MSKRQEQKSSLAKGRSEVRVSASGPSDVGARIRTTIGEALWPPLPGTRGASLLAMQYQFQRTERYPVEVIREAQFRQLLGLLHHANTTVPYYRKRFAAMGLDIDTSLDQQIWANVPQLARVDIQQAGNELVSTAIPDIHRTLSIISTSGSIGTPVSVHTTRVTQFFFDALTLRKSLWQNLDFSQKLVGIRLPKNEKEALYPDGHLSPNWGSSIHAAFESGPTAVLNIMTPVQQQVEWLQRQKAAYLVTYPSNLMELLHYCKENAVRFPELRSVETLGEVLYP